MRLSWPGGAYGSPSILPNAQAAWYHNRVSQTFAQRLNSAFEASGSLVCIGLDPDPNKLPKDLGPDAGRIHAFDRRIVDATHDIAAAYKPQIAFYSALGAEDQLESSIRYIRERAPNALVILDAKRGDIGNTAAAYARARPSSATAPMPSPSIPTWARIPCGPFSRARIRAR
jgi:hypothetical protein